MNKVKITHPLKRKLYEIIFEADTVAGKIFDIFLLSLITISVVVIFLESVPSLQIKYQPLFHTLEVTFTFIFALEYLLRLWVLPQPMKFAKSFYGIIDLMAIIPTILELVFPQLHFLLIIRALRLLRIFRIFRMLNFLKDSLVIVNSLWAARRKIMVFFFAVILITIIAGTVMYMIENGQNNGFSSIPKSIYWAIVTLTTVGYGDVTPITALGKTLASFIMLLGYCIIAVPTGIVSASIAKEMSKHDVNTQTCPQCFKEGHDTNASFCKYCGEHL